MPRFIRQPIITWVTLFCFVLTSFSSLAATPLPVPPASPIIPGALWENIFDIADFLHDEIDTTQYSIKDLSRQLKNNPASIFKFVNQQVRFEAYAGALRGARGALEGKAGNSLDMTPDDVFEIRF